MLRTFPDSCHRGQGFWRVAKLSMLRTDLQKQLNQRLFWRVAKLSMLRTLKGLQIQYSQFWRVAKLSMLRTDGNRTEEAYATNYQKQPSVAVFFCGSIINKLMDVFQAASPHFLPAGFFFNQQKCYYEFL